MSVRDNRKGKKHKNAQVSVELNNYAAIAQHSAASVTINTNTSGEVTMKKEAQAVVETKAVETPVAVEEVVVAQATATEEAQPVEETVTGEAVVNKNALTIKLWLETLQVDFKPVAGITLLGLTGEQVVNMFSLPKVIPGVVVTALLEEAEKVEQLSQYITQLKMLAKLTKISEDSDAVDVVKIIDFGLAFAKPVIVDKVLPVWDKVTHVVSTFIGGKVTPATTPVVTEELIPKEVIRAAKALASDKEGAAASKHTLLDEAHVPCALTLTDIVKARSENRKAADNRSVTPAVIPVADPEKTTFGDLFKQADPWGTSTMGY